MIKEKLKKEIENSLIKNNIKICFPIIIQKNKFKKMGHFQINNLFSISNKCKINYLILVKKIIKKINYKKMIKKINFSKPCFINIFLNPEWVIKEIEKIFRKEFFFKKNNKKVVIDYSSPNVAKSMHVGHLRSTIIGDSMAKIMEFTGYNVIRVNHIGDWGNQFGMLIAYLKKKNIYDINNMSINDIEKIYCQAKKTSLIDKKFLQKTEKYTAKLQQNCNYYNNIWKKVVQLTLKKNKEIYKLLNISLKDQNICGESFYKHIVKKIIKNLLQKKIAVIKNGNVIVFLKHLKNRKGEEMGIILQKKSGVFLYSAIDIACMKYRCKKLQANIILYYIDSRQKQYIQQIYEIAKKAGYISQKTKIKHHIFGMMLSQNNHPFQTRSGKTIKLIDLIQTSIQRAKKIILKKNKKITKTKLSDLSKKIGIGALKYSDLSKNRKTNYVFKFKNMISFEGNTSLYIQYTYIRIFSILKRFKKNVSNLKEKIMFVNNDELNLSIKILEFKEIILETVKTGQPHLICKYLYKISSIYSKFYEKHKILNKKNKKIRNSRLKISFLVSKILKKGLNLLGIETIESI
ncbi:Arginine--tRNA ligase [Buchnera aphidicola (Sipha maydis)]|uniref:arginine--tRNA ligase n=1 Tax=Buchnera aphidicola TaxID=9 RepID=UPI00346472F0